ncbi:sugar kinase [Thioclava sp. SK-1]|uniref:ROK family transcriptional regulator n=1 Tax=Thioclava sp. SK-1 TaxID=1889770 RepID=UPI000824C9C3|nr:ROK family transcriptional regulator [Thioclava sp. SK-1]OCX66912.1 sugar kinase [Thioclava sp. SK-1]
MDGSERRGLRGGVNQIGVRQHNERLIMTLISRAGALPGTEIAKRTQLSAQTVSNILRKLENDGFLLRGEPQRGRVGKPSIPMALDPNGALSVGLKLGRRTSDLSILNLTGEVLGQKIKTYKYPMPNDIFGFLRDGLAELSADLTEYQRGRIAGIGIAAPSEIWSWIDVLGAPLDFAIWRDIDIAKEVANFSDLPVFMENDGTAACRAEHVFGRGRELTDYAYFYLGSFVGGGIVLNGSLVGGIQGNAGAFGSLRVPSSKGGMGQLIDEASLYLLENALGEVGVDREAMWHQPQDWSQFGDSLNSWIARAAKALAHAARSVCAVIDFSTILIDGAFPAAVRAQLVAQTQIELDRLDKRGLQIPAVEAATVGGNARVIGAASIPVLSQFFLE